MGVLQTFNLAGRVALITGAGRGIGLAIAQALAEAGARVALQDIDLTIAQAETKKLTDAGYTAVALGGDVTDLADVERWVPATLEALGAIDILVNNASIQESHSLEDWPLEIADTISRANLLAPFRLCQLVVPHMRAQRWGRILNIGSIQGLHGGGEMMPYAASKGAIHNLTLSLARTLGRDGITCNALAPGIIDTYRNQSLAATRRADQFDWLPIRRIGQPADCAAIALLLCSDAGSYITGDVISVDGGMHAR